MLSNKVPQSIFRAYDIRGVVDEALTPEVVFLIGRAIGSELELRSQKSIFVARDGRLSSPRLSQALIDGLMQSGRHVIDLGEVPTPLLYFATNVLPTKYGVMLTGSHNPPDYNGLKMVFDGGTISADQIQQLYQRIIAEEFCAGEGSLETLVITQQYIEHVCGHVNLESPLKIVIDAGNSVVGNVAPTLFKRLGCDVVELFCEVDGRFPNHHPDPSRTIS